MPKMRNALVVIAVLALAVWAPSCKKEPEVVPQPAPAPAAAPEPATPPPVEEVEEPKDFEAAPIAPPKLTAEEIMAQGHLQTVYFEFDQYDLSDESRRILKANADWLKANAEWNTIVEGHCDERGTIEYNLALGEKRARTVQDYLISLGLDASRIRIISYGEEKPQDMGHGESAWAKNRRAHFVPEQ